MANYNGKKKVRVTAGSIKNSGSTWRDTEDKGKHTEKVRVTAGHKRNPGGKESEAGGKAEKEQETGGAGERGGENSVM